MALSKGLAGIRRVSLGGQPVKKVSLGSHLVWADTKEFREDWDTLDTSVWWRGGDDSSSDGLYVSGGALRAGDTKKWDTWTINYVNTWEQYLSPAARWRMKLAGTPNRLLTRLGVSTSAGAPGQMVALDVTRSKLELQYRSSRSESFQRMASRSYTVPADAIIQVDRTESSRYTVRVNGVVVMEASDAGRRGENPILGHISVGIQSEQNVFFVKSRAASVDWVDYTDDV